MTNLSKSKASLRPSKKTTKKPSSVNSKQRWQCERLASFSIYLLLYADNGSMGFQSGIATAVVQE